MPTKTNAQGMTNDKFQMTKERHSVLFRHSAFGFRYSLVVGHWWGIYQGGGVARDAKR